MSDTNTLNTIITQVSYKVYMYIIITIVSLCVLSSLLTMNCGRYNHMSVYNEYFTSGRETIDYQMINLRYPSTEDEELFIDGQAEKLLIKETDTNDDVLIYNIKANLYILNGNVFGPEFNQDYKVYIKSDANKILLGSLTKHGDGSYRLERKIKYDKNVDILSDLIITHKFEDKESVILIGKFA